MRCAMANCAYVQIGTTLSPLERGPSGVCLITGAGGSPEVWATANVL